MAFASAVGERLRALARYILDRAREPGTMRSIVWALLGLLGHRTSADPIAEYTSLGIFALGALSALMPDRKP